MNQESANNARPPHLCRLRYNLFDLNKPQSGAFIKEDVDSNSPIEFFDEKSYLDEEPLHRIHRGR